MNSCELLSMDCEVDFSCVLLHCKGKKKEGIERLVEDDKM